MKEVSVDSEDNTTVRRMQRMNFFNALAIARPRATVSSRLDSFELNS